MASQTPDDSDTAVNITADSGRNPYELRFDLLHLAKDILEQNAHMAREDDAQDRKTFFTTAEVIETAQQLNKFVSKR
jgi:hypothetical protein